MGHPVLLHHSPQLNPVGQTDLGANEDTSEAIFERYEANGWLVNFQGRSQPVLLPWGGGTGGFIDYSHPDAVADQQQLIRRVTDLGAIGVKMDWDEYLQANVGPQRLYMEFHNGETNQTMHGWYSALYHRTNIEAFDRALGGPSFSISRSGLARDQVWNSCIWPGDLGNDWAENTTAKMPAEGEWKVGGLPAAYYGALSLGMSGYPCYGSDIGGYRGGLSTEEVLLRWLELGIFHPVTQLGGAGSAHMPWVAGSPYSADAVAVTRDYFKLRNQLTLYAFGEVNRATQTGAPFVRSLWFQYPDLPEARAFDREFLFGPDLLVAPVTREGESSVTLLLPPGGWLDWWSGERHEGPATLTVEAPIGRVPLFFREGAVLPLLDPRLHSLKPASDPTVIGYDELRDTEVVVAATPVEATLPNGIGVTVASAPARSVAVRFGAPAATSTEEDWFAPSSVLVRLLLGGTELADVGPATVVLTDAEGTRDLAPTEWSYDAARRQLQVRLTTDGTLELR
jgi:alpha-glucosidase (family GH31 glycosyl hydrolase)